MRCMIISVIATGCLFMLSDKACSQKDAINQTNTIVKAGQVDSTEKDIKKKENKTYKLAGYKFDGGGIIDNLSMSASTSFGTHGVLMDSVFDDYFTLSYDYVGLREENILLAPERKKIKEKKLLALNYLITYKGKPFVNVDYRSDRGISIHTIYLTGGIERSLPHGFTTKFGFGWKRGNVNFATESFDVVKALMEYKMPSKRAYKIDAYLNIYLPRNKLIDSDFGGLWIFDSKFLFAINKSICGIIPTLNAKITRDYLPAINGTNVKSTNYIQVIRYLLTVGFSRSSGNVGKLKK